MNKFNMVIGLASLCVVGSVSAGNDGYYYAPNAAMIGSAYSTVYDNASRPSVKANVYATGLMSHRTTVLDVQHSARHGMTKVSCPGVQVAAGQGRHVVAVDGMGNRSLSQCSVTRDVHDGMKKHGRFVHNDGMVMGDHYYQHDASFTTGPGGYPRSAGMGSSNATLLNPFDL